MPTFTAIALENLLEPRVAESLKKPDGDGRSRHLYISPALYATPEQSPIPDYSFRDPPSPSPYVANHKRRGGGHVKVPETRRARDETESFNLDEEEEEKCSIECVDSVSEEDGECFDPRIQVVSSDFSQIQLESRSFVSAQGEFFDAIDDFSDGSISNTPSRDHRLESELFSSKLNLLDEIEKRKTAEETILLMLSQWEKIRILMSEAGLNFPAPPAISDTMQLEDREMDKFSQEVVVAKFVAEAVGRGLARAEAEEAASAIIELKDLEILRLRDRLQYYETVNHELSQRKLVEVARRQQERKSRRRWVWSFMGLAFGIGTSLAAYSYICHTNECVPALECADSAESVPVETSYGH
ncbi:hypothetical protein SASPL_123549 [Salvia splendens]|uniref:Uncharacterized protein n=1 Tax=Salvia splendens TaxID=180675 RepID=A0A8X8XLM5_SALSN|nr:uncharacterized protein LOC121742939 [Salvia splendens]KAG6416125.1 hypothetical protein SASPL_123549 [Salvia splendens]